MPKIILFNGPPRSGKDTATKFALRELGAFGAHYRFAAPLKDAAHALFGMSGIDTEHFDEMKDCPRLSFFGMKPRDVYIWLSEEVVKPKFGRDFFTKVAIKKLNEYPDQVVVISDCGFVEEVQGLAEAFGAENITMVFIQRDGTNFQNDSRSYLNDVPCRKHFTINNNHGFDYLIDRIRDVIYDVIYAKP